MLWVPDGTRLVPVRANDFRDTLILTVMAPIGYMTIAHPGDRIPEPELPSEVARLAREAVVATEAFRRTLRAELDKVNNYLRTNSAMAALAMNLRNPQSVREHLLTTWRLQMIVTDQSSEFREQATILRQASGSTLLVTDVACQPAVPPKMNCNLAGRVNWRGTLRAPISVPNADRLVEELRMGSFASQGTDNTGQIRFRISAGFDVGGNLDFSASLNAATGAMEGGTISWAASGRSNTVGTWSAVRELR